MKNEYLENKITDWRRANLAVRRVIEIKPKPYAKELAIAEGLVKNYEMKYSDKFRLDIEPFE